MDDDDLGDTVMLIWYISLFLAFVVSFGFGIYGGWSGYADQIIILMEDNR